MDSWQRRKFLSKFRLKNTTTTVAYFKRILVRKETQLRPHFSWYTQQTQTTTPTHRSTPCFGLVVRYVPAFNGHNRLVPRVQKAAVVHGMTIAKITSNYLHVAVSERI